MRNWKNYNESLVRRGEILLDFDVIDNWNTELIEMNKNKEGRKFVYPDSFIKLLIDVKPKKDKKIQEKQE